MTLFAHLDCAYAFAGAQLGETRREASPDMQDTTQPKPAPGGPRVDAHAIDYGLIALLCTHAMMTQVVYAMVRVTISYRTIELGLEPI